LRAEEELTTPEELSIHERIKVLVEEKNFRISDDFIQEFDRAVMELLKRAIRRGEIERRKTLLPRHV